MESLYTGLFGEIYRSGSLLGFFLLIYSSAVSALCIAKKKFEPLRLSGMETSSYANIVEGLILPAIIVGLAYSIAYTSIFNGFLIWAISSTVVVLLVKVVGFNFLAGVHSLLSGVSLAAGVYMVLKTLPF